MKLRGMCDLHCHYLPQVDDGVRSSADGRALCLGLAELGFTTVVATPHMRAGMFDNHKPQLLAAYEAFVAEAAGAGLPETGLAAEHFYDDVFFERLERGEALPYPGGHAALVEFANDRLPLRVEHGFFRMQVRGVRPVLAHPERYSPLWKNDEPLRMLTERGVLALLDMMALVGKYGQRPQRAAEAFLEDELYYAACTDSHKPDDLELVANAIERLTALAGVEIATRLLAEHPRRILAGTVQD
jgi:protein-tyrosine phosphatase